MQKGLAFEPFDYEFNLKVEQQMFKEQAEFFEKSNICVEDARNSEICKLLVKLIDIITGEDEAIQLDRKHVKWELLKYVNIQNYKRFYKGNDIDFRMPLWMDELRQLKAWYLYNKIRFYKMQELWN